MKQLKTIVMFFLLAAFGFQAAAQDINMLETPYEKARAALADSAVAAIMKNHHQDFGVYNADGGVVFYFELDTRGTE